MPDASQKSEKELFLDAIAEVKEAVKSESESVRSKVGETIEQLQSLDAPKRREILDYMVNAGYWITEKKANTMERGMRLAEKGSQRNRMAHTFFGKFGDIYKEQAENAHKAQANQEKTDIARAVGVGQGFGTIVRMIRVLDDIGYANPFRHWMAGSMATGRIAEAAKETRFEYEGAKENTRVQDEEQAMNEAWDLLEAAKKEQGSDQVDASAMEEAYRRNLPADLKKRLARLDEGNNSAWFGKRAANWFMNKHMGLVAGSLERKLKRVEAKNLSPEEEKQAKDAVLAKYRKKIDDLDRMVGDMGTVDAAAYIFRTTEKAGKTAAMAFTVDSLTRLPKSLPRLANWLFDHTSTEAGASELPAETQAQIQAQKGGRINEILDEYDQSEKWSKQEASTLQKPVVPTGQGEARLENSVREEAGYETTLEQYDPAVDAEPEVPSSAVIGKGEGIEHALIRQYMESPKTHGFIDGGGDFSDKQALRKWAEREAHKAAVNYGYVDAKTGKEIWMRKSAIGNAAYVLNKDGSVSEFIKDDKGYFLHAESHPLHDVFEGKKVEGRNMMEEHEYVDKLKKVRSIADQGLKAAELDPDTAKSHIIKDEDHPPAEPAMADSSPESLAAAKAEVRARLNDNAVTDFISQDQDIHDGDKFMQEKVRHLLDPAYKEDDIYGIVHLNAFKDYLAEAAENIGPAEPNESAEHFLSRYEQWKLKSEVSAGEAAPQAPEPPPVPASELPENSETEARSMTIDEAKNLADYEKIVMTPEMFSSDVNFLDLNPSSVADALNERNAEFFTSAKGGELSIRPDLWQNGKIEIKHPDDKYDSLMINFKDKTYVFENADNNFADGDWKQKSNYTMANLRADLKVLIDDHNK